MQEIRNPEQEKAAKEIERTKFLRERGESFPEVHTAMESYEKAEEERRVFLEELERNARSLPGMEKLVLGRLKDWATNLIPGAQTMKKAGDWIRINLGSSLKYSAAPYMPTTGRELLENLKTLTELEIVAVKLKVGDALKTTEKNLVKAEGELQVSLEKLSNEEKIALVELQQKIFEMAE